jgi:ribosomal protein S18 acetylase RimI-like enzyme
MNYIVRFVKTADENKIRLLYQEVATGSGGIAREADEITPDYIANNLQKALKNGIGLVIDHPQDAGRLIAEIHCSKPEPRSFDHVLSDLTVVVHPDFQGKGLGRLLFTTLLQHIKSNRPDILRVELITKESNNRAIALYQQTGFVIEGRFEKRINSKGVLEADIPMAWFNSGFEGH